MPTLVLLAVCLLTSGCMHRQATMGNTLRLVDTASYPLLVPSRPSSPSGNRLVDTRVDLGQIGIPLHHNAGSHCSIEGPVFSLRPPDQSGATLWVVTSPGVNDWETHGDQIDTVAEWSHFTRKLQLLQTSGCFASGWALSRYMQTIGESIPIPANELLLFYYAYNGTGAVDLVPGMQIRVERGILEGRKGDQTMKSIEAQYAVLASSASGVALRLSQTANRKLSRSTEAEDRTIFDLIRLTQRSTMLRLFLQSRTDSGVERRPILLFSSSSEGLDKATRQLDSTASYGCASMKIEGTGCVAFVKSAVSLMISCTVNGKLTFKPFGTTVAQAVDDSQSAIHSLVLTRSLAGGGDAQLSFPRTIDAANQVTLVHGDRLSW